ncbi:hypothetical protein NKI77_09125 [Mesorhizobium opportunistum]|uniref:Uncharacterized protein n=1 Tax=Mesorhizobium opportunistum TaxID=593909 RepID=A0ABV1YCC3_9HYPH|nr:hypothetical protein [Mesorhizobium sp.]TIN95016.1 MAG: hypothetical protein E5Y06_14310 [Mesorhizobium sp.]TJU96995.1 MAG: hypothetical protein E5Y08_19870 [Mesorhizobium sp.]TJV18136.1 MAG: hypothetical protein E5Y07_10885 [Mesorhizobium sp.]
MFDRTMAADRLPTTRPPRKIWTRYRPALFLISVSLLLGSASTAEAQHRGASCPANQLIDAKENWKNFTSNDEATEFAKRKFLALGAEEFVKWLSCQSFEVRVSPGRGTTTNIHASFMPLGKDEGLWVPSGVYYWLFPPGRHYIEAHIENGRLIDITATAESE